MRSFLRALLARARQANALEEREKELQHEREELVRGCGKIYQGIREKWYQERDDFARRCINRALDRLTMTASPKPGDVPHDFAFEIIESVRAEQAEKLPRTGGRP